MPVIQTLQEKNEIDNEIFDVDERREIREPAHETIVTSSDTLAIGSKSNSTHNADEPAMESEDHDEIYDESVPRPMIDFDGQESIQQESERLIRQFYEGEGAYRSLEQSEFREQTRVRDYKNSIAASVAKLEAMDGDKLHKLVQKATALQKEFGALRVRETRELKGQRKWKKSFKLERLSSRQKPPNNENKPRSRREVLQLAKLAMDDAIDEMKAVGGNGNFERAFSLINGRENELSSTCCYDGNLCHFHLMSGLRRLNDELGGEELMNVMMDVKARRDGKVSQEEFRKILFRACTNGTDCDEVLSNVFMMLDWDRQGAIESVKVVGLLSLFLIGTGPDRLRMILDCCDGRNGATLSEEDLTSLLIVAFYVRFRTTGVFDPRDDESDFIGVKGDEWLAVAQKKAHEMMMKIRHFCGSSSVCGEDLVNWVKAYGETRFVIDLLFGGIDNLAN